MRIFSRSNLSASPEETSLANRLQAVTDRGKVETACYPLREEPVEVKGPKRLFQVLAEISAETPRA